VHGNGGARLGETDRDAPPDAPVTSATLPLKSKRLDTLGAEVIKSLPEREQGTLATDNRI
jgi:hypothetical protein